MGRQLELIDGSGKSWKINVQAVKMTYPVDELIKCSPSDKVLYVQQSIVHIQNTRKISVGHQIQMYYLICETIIWGLPI